MHPPQAHLLDARVRQENQAKSTIEKMRLKGAPHLQASILHVAQRSLANPYEIFKTRHAYIPHLHTRIIPPSIGNT
jgi:hypothetical protein